MGHKTWDFSLDVLVGRQRRWRQRHRYGVIRPRRGRQPRRRRLRPTVAHQRHRGRPPASTSSRERRPHRRQRHHVGRSRGGVRGTRQRRFWPRRWRRHCQQQRGSVGVGCRRPPTCGRQLQHPNGRGRRSSSGCIRRHCRRCGGSHAATDAGGGRHGGATRDDDRSGGNGGGGRRRRRGRRARNDGRRGGGGGTRGGRGRQPPHGHRGGAIRGGGGGGGTLVRRRRLHSAAAAASAGGVRGSVARPATRWVPLAPRLRSPLGRGAPPAALQPDHPPAPGGRHRARSRASRRPRERGAPRHSLGAAGPAAAVAAGAGGTAGGAPTRPPACSRRPTSGAVARQPTLRYSSCCSCSCMVEPLTAGHPARWGASGPRLGIWGCWAWALKGMTCSKLTMVST